MGQTSIEWVRNRDGSQGWTINPIRARNKETGKLGHFCEKISAGCKNCYASRMQSPYLTQLEYTAENRDKVELYFDDSAIEQVIRRKKPTTFFWCDMTDLFGSWVPGGWIDKCSAAMALTQRHTHIVLTKRPARALQRENSGGVSERTYDLVSEHVSLWGDDDYSEAALDHFRWPLANVWLGVSVEDQATADERIPLLLQTPAAVRFISAEPLLGPVDLSHFLPLANYGGGSCCHPSTLDWVIVGGESGPGARPMNAEWAQSIRDQCRAAKVPFFFKQWGEYLPDKQNPAMTEAGRDLAPEWAAIRVGKKAAGRLLDGREWNEMPEVSHAR